MERTWPNQGKEKSPNELEAEIVRLSDERRRLLRQRRIHLVLLGLAVSLPVHIALIVWLANIAREQPAAPGPAPVVLELSVLPDDQLQEMLDPLDSEDMLTPEPEVDSGDEAMSEVILPADLPTVELVGTDGATLQTVSGGDSGSGLGEGMGAGTGAGASFFGINAAGNRIAYIVDISGSMNQSGKIIIAINELKRSIRALPDYASFMVFLYANSPVVPDFQRNWLRASSQNVKRISSWLDQIGPAGGTYPVPAFQLAFRLSVRPDAIFFMTDGLIPPDTVPVVSQLNDGGRSVQINCIAFGSEAGQGPLRKLALESDGTFRFVPVGGRFP